MNLGKPVVESRPELEVVNK